MQDVLLHFGDTIKVARRRYRQFVKNGVDQARPPRLRPRDAGRGTRPELQGGGLVRPACHARDVNIWKQKNSGIVQAMLERQVEGKARAGRSAGGNKSGLLGRKKEERPARLSLQRWRAGKREMKEFWEAESLLETSWLIQRKSRDINS